MTLAQTETTTFRFHIWERLRLEAGETGKEGWYSCRVSDIRDGCLVISRPDFERGHSLLADSREVTVYCARGDAAYAFRARIRETEPKSPDTMHLLALSRVSRIQRRRFVRLDMTIPLTYRVVTRPLETTIDLSPENLTESSSINLSAGGLLILTPHKVTANDLLLLFLGSCSLWCLPNWVLAACRHASVIESNQAVAGIEFILREDLPRHLSGRELNLIPNEAAQYDDKMQNLFVSELFAEQLLMRQKGIL